MSPRNTGRGSLSAVGHHVFQEAKRDGGRFGAQKRGGAGFLKGLLALVVATVVCSVIALTLGEALLGWMGTP